MSVHSDVKIFGCVLDSQDVRELFNPLPTGKPSANTSFTVYPNPSINDDFYLSSNGTLDKDLFVTIYDVNGREVASSQNIDEHQHFLQLSLNAPKPGLYIANVRSSDGQNISSIKLSVR